MRFFKRHVKVSWCNLALVVMEEVIILLYWYLSPRLSDETLHMVYSSSILHNYKRKSNITSFDSSKTGVICHYYIFGFFIHRLYRKFPGWNTVISGPHSYHPGDYFSKNATKQIMLFSANMTVQLKWRKIRDVTVDIRCKRRCRSNDASRGSSWRYKVQRLFTAGFKAFWHTET